MPFSQPRIAYVVKRYPRFSETFIVNEILAHEEAGCDVDIFSLRPPSDTHFQNRISQVRGCVTYLDRENRGSKASALWQLIQAAERRLPGIYGRLEHAAGEEAADVYQGVQLALAAVDRGIDHLHAHFATSAATVARLASRFSGIPYTMTAHAKDIFHESVKPADLRRKLSEASGVITVSDFNLKHLRETYGDAATGVVRIFNGLDLDVYPYRPPQRRTLSVIAVGRLVEKKGFDDLVSACACLADRRDDFRCTIIGEGDCEAALRRQIAELNLEGVVDLAGPRPQPEVIAAVQSSAVFAAPCVVGNDGNRDGMPTVLLESMALGTPCVATPVTGIPEVVHHNKTGLIVPERQPQQLADVLSHLLDNPSERVRLATQARELIEAEFDVRRNAARLRDTFAGVHHNSKARPRLHEEVEVLQGVS